MGVGIVEQNRPGRSPLTWIVSLWIRVWSGLGRLWRGIWSWIDRERDLPSYAVTYFLQFVGRYTDAIAETDKRPSAAITSVLQRVASVDPALTGAKRINALRSLVSWSDIFAVESALVAALPDADLPTALREWRLRYGQLATPTEFASYLSWAVKDPGAVDASGIVLESPAKLRAELVTITDRMQYLYTFAPSREARRNNISMWAVLLIVLLLLLMLVLFVVLPKNDKDGIWTKLVPPEPIALSIICGMAGGFISVQQRLQQSTDLDPLLKDFELRAGGRSLIIAPILGIVFGVVLYFIFAGNLLNGVTFPNLACTTSEAHPDFKRFIHCATPADAFSWGKLGVWAFIAGFAERFVPDVLTRITTSRDQTK